MTHLSVYVSLSLSASISLELLDRSSRNCVCGSPLTMAWSSGSVVLHYVLPVLWMTSRSAVMGRMALCGQPERLAGLAISYMHDLGGV